MSERSMQRSRRMFAYARTFAAPGVSLASVARYSSPPACSTMNADWHRASIDYAMQNVAAVTTTDEVLRALG